MARILCWFGWHVWGLQRRRYATCTILVRFCTRCGDSPTWDR